MANVQSVISLIRDNDSNVKLSCFDDYSSSSTGKKLYDEWLEFLRNKLGNCGFSGNLHTLLILSEDGPSFPVMVASTDNVIQMITNCFKQPKTFRLELITPYSTTFSWLFVLVSDLTK